MNISQYSSGEKIEDNLNFLKKPQAKPTDQTKNNMQNKKLKLK